jgi:hypothetical protein
MTSPGFFQKMNATVDSSPTSPNLPPQIGRMLAAADVTLPSGRMTVAQVDKLLADKKLSTADRMNVKGALARAGLID